MLTTEEKIQLLELTTELEKRKRELKLHRYYPDSGPLRRSLYPKHCQFFEAGKDHRERLMLAANRVGKTEGVGGYELTLHLTGMYPDWWTGRRYDRAVRAWACGDTGKTVREIIQHKLLGPVGSWGTGLIPGKTIERIVRGTGTADTAEVVYVRHVSGQQSALVMKSYEQGRKAFQGTEQDIVWLDEEPPLEVYTESLLRTMTNEGMVLLTFTPLLGMSQVVLQFLPGGKLDEPARGSKFVVMATWDDAPHLSQAAKDELWASIPPFQRDARSKGIPQLGAGAIYPIAESDIVIEPFQMPAHWPAGYGMDVGWNSTAAVWGRLDRETDILYLTSEYKRGQAEPPAHVAAIKAPGAWQPGFIDPASRGRSQRDGSQLFEDYCNLGLKLEMADNGVESGIFSVWNRMATGRLKVFRSLGNWLQEFRLYRRNEKGQVVKEGDHLMDATRYLESRVSQMIIKPVVREPRPQLMTTGQISQNWMA